MHSLDSDFLNPTCFARKWYYIRYLWLDLAVGVSAAAVGNDLAELEVSDARLTRMNLHKDG